MYQMAPPIGSITLTGTQLVLHHVLHNTALLLLILSSHVPALVKDSGETSFSENFPQHGSECA